jgi:site-specific recombinase XerD
MKSEKKGLTAQEVKLSLEKYGSNALNKEKTKSFLRRFFENLSDPIIRVLLIAVLIEIIFTFGRVNILETVGILAAVFIATMVSTVSEHGSERAFLSMQKDAKNTMTKVVRDGKLTKIPIDNIVVGDLIFVESGECIPCDGRITEGKISVDQSALNGESVEVGDDIRAAKWSSLNTFFKFLHQKKHIENNPMLLTERPRVRTKHNITYLTQQEIESVFQKISEEARPMVKNRDICIVAMGLGTGLRVSAIVNIDMEDIDFRTKTIKVIEKGRKTRNINFGENLKRLLLVWMKDRELYFQGEANGPLFVSQLKQRMSVDSVEKLVKKYTSHLPKKITPHKLRSSAAMNLHGAGVDILTIASILGHENVATTQRYTKAYDEDKINASNILDSYF